MTTYEIIFSRRADAHIDEVRLYIAERASPELANDYVDRIIEYCYTLATYPKRGQRRPDLRADARSISFEGRVTIVYRIKAYAVEVIAISYAGRDLGRLLR